MKEPRGPFMCECEGWAKNLPLINGYIDVGRIHGMGEYRGERFHFCPWCGKELTTKEKKLK
jgi:hypothetical protein